MTSSAASFIGTAGWQHTHWRERFYPRHLPAHAWLGHYGQQLNTVELDAARLERLDRNLSATLRRSVPPQFAFTFQAPRLITHVHKLRNCTHLVEAMLGRLAGLERQLGPVVFSLPQRWHCNLERLERFVAELPAGFRYAFEFHDPDWRRPDTYALLKERGAALCLNDRMPLDQQEIVTGSFVYVRLYGPRTGGRYTSLGLRAWAARLAVWQRRRLESYVLFQNDMQAHAVKDACLLRDLQGLGPAKRAGR
jgi:uncharacterized protein YecE (DUF72 family)